MAFPTDHSTAKSEAKAKVDAGPPFELSGRGMFSTMTMMKRTTTKAPQRPAGRAAYARRAAPLLALLLAGATAVQAAEGKWVSLFNGRNLDGWAPKITGYPLAENFGQTFRVEDGLLKVRYDAYGNQFKGRFGHLFYKQPFSHYRLRVEYRFVGEQLPGGPGWAWRNSGLMLHGQSPESMGKQQKFPVSIEVQLLGGHPTGQRTTANLCTPGTNVIMDGKLHTQHCTNSKSETYRGDRWVTVEVEVHGNRIIKHLIDGKVVLQYEHPQLDPRDPDAKRLLASGTPLQLSGGSISLQSESHPCDFRKVEIMVLDE